jgi:hypothetical protein
MVNDIYLAVDLDGTATIRREQNLVTDVDLGGDVLAILVKSTLTSGNDITFVKSFLGLLWNQNTRSSFLFERQAF